MKYTERKEWKYEVFENEWVDLKFDFGEIITEFFEIHGKRMLIKKGYRWDGPTWAIDTKDFLLPSCVHDVICECIRKDLLPISRLSDGDKELRYQCIKKGMWKVRAWWVYRAVSKASKHFIGRYIHEC
jgi:hypothetical protein